MLAEGIIEPSDSPWSSFPVIVPKSNGKCCFCIDYRQVNAVSWKDAYLLPNMDDILDKLRAARYIFTLDLSQAYHQIASEQNRKEITAFSVPGQGLMQFVRMPYGLSNSPATFQRIMDQLIRPEWSSNVYAYLDDIVIVSEIFEEHMYWLKTVLQALKDANLELNREKSHFCRSEVKYLGYKVNEEGLKTDPEKIKPIMEYSAPTNLKQLRRFLGMIGWYARFLDSLSKDKIPLFHHLKKNTKWHWHEEQEAAFEKLKLALM